RCVHQGLRPRVSAYGSKNCLRRLLCPLQDTNLPPTSILQTSSPLTPEGYCFLQGLLFFAFSTPERGRSSEPSHRHLPLPGQQSQLHTRVLPGRDCLSGLYSLSL
ncbi:cellular retinoic acid binding protein II, isoform CRA_b, partial [Mus musculus]